MIRETVPRHDQQRVPPLRAPLLAPQRTALRRSQRRPGTQPGRPLSPPHQGDARACGARRTACTVVLVKLADLGIHGLGSAIGRARRAPRRSPATPTANSAAGRSTETAARRFRSNRSHVRQRRLPDGLTQRVRARQPRPLRPWPRRRPVRTGGTCTERTSRHRALAADRGVDVQGAVLAPTKRASVPRASRKARRCRRLVADPGGRGFST